MRKNHNDVYKIEKNFPWKMKEWQLATIITGLNKSCAVYNMFWHIRIF